MESSHSTDAGQTLKDSVNQARSIINSAQEVTTVDHKARIIRLLCTYRPREGQLDAFHHLIYSRKDLILIAKTSFGKNMVLQAVSVLLS
jgi:hypothetical protein